jgi:hypothetical protein
MITYFIDFLIVAVLIIGITAINGVITNTLGKTLFGKRKKFEFVDQSMHVQSGWKKVGGRD